MADRGARFKLVRAGRRWGKDRLDLHVSVLGHGPGQKHKGLVHGLDVVWLAPDFTQAGTIWTEEIRPRFRGNPYVHLNESEHSLRIQDHGTLYIRSSENVDSIRGIGKRLAGVVVNEAAHLDLEYAFRKVIRPALMDLKGWCLMTSTTNSNFDGNPLKRSPSYFNLLCLAVMSGQKGKDWAHFYGTAFDNPVLDRSEIEELIAEYPADAVSLKEEVYAELLEGAQGLVFKEWRTEYHVLPEGFRVPSGWAWGSSIDWGHRAPGCFTIFADGPDGEVYGMDQLYFRQLSAFDAGKRCGRLCQQWPPVPYIAAADEYMWVKSGAGPTVAEEFQRGINEVYGERPDIPVLIAPGRGKGWRAAKLNLMHQMLQWQPDKDGKVPPWGMPRLRYHPRCTDSIRTLPRLPYARDVAGRQVDDVDSSAEDHCYDCDSAYLMTRPRLGERPKKPRNENIHPGFDRSGRRKREDMEPQAVPAYEPEAWISAVHAELEEVRE